MVTDPAARSEINEARGYCRRHSWLLDRVGAALGTAILTRGVIKTLLDVLASRPVADEPETVLLSLRRRLDGKQSQPGPSPTLDALVPKTPCPLCLHHETVEGHLIDTLVNHMTGSDSLSEVYARSDGLCFAHFCQALAAAPSSPQARALADAQEGIWQQLYEELGEFIRKKDVKHRAETFGPEKDAWLRALAAIAGPPPGKEGRE
jgi:hypothetical protein